MTPVVRFAATVATIAGLSISGAAVAKKKDKPAPLAVGRVALPPEEPTATIAQALPTLDHHATLTRLVQASPVAPTLAGAGPFTVFAPSDDAFARLAPGTVDTLMKPENVATLATILKTHVVQGAYTVEQIRALVTAGNGTAALPTLSGQTLTASIENGNLLLTDPTGNKSYVSQPDVKEANGIVHITNGVSVPKLS